MNTLVITNLDSKKQFEFPAEYLDGVLTAFDALRRNGDFLPRMTMKIVKKIENK